MSELTVCLIDFRGDLLDFKSISSCCTSVWSQIVEFVSLWALKSESYLWTGRFALAVCPHVILTSGWWNWCQEYVVWEIQCLQTLQHACLSTCTVCFLECNACLHKLVSAHLWFITSVTESGCSGSLSPYPHTSIFTSLLLTNPLETKWLGDKTDRLRDGRQGRRGEGSNEGKALCCPQTDVCQNKQD